MLVVHCVSSPCMCTDQSTAALLLPVVSRLKRHIVILPGTASCDMKTAVNLNFSNSHAGDASAVLPFPPEDEELLQQAVITALRLHPHSNALELSYSVWPRHSDVQRDRARRSAMQVVVRYTC